jgi:hypothetical protein
MGASENAASKGKRWCMGSSRARAAGDSTVFHRLNATKISTVIYYSTVIDVAHERETQAVSNVTLPKPIDRFIAAVNKNDTAAFLAFFPRDGVVDDWGSRYASHDAIRKWSDREFIGVQVKLTVTSVKQSGREVSITADVGGHGFNGPSRFAFVVDSDQVREMRITES